MAALKRNISLIIIIRGLISSWMIIPTLALFYLEQGLSLSDLLLFKTVLSAVALALEIPSGYLADVWGRKRTGILGCLFWAGSLSAYCLGSEYFHFLLAEILLGVAAALISGIDSAIVFDSLLSIGEVSSYRKIESRLSSVSGFAESAGGLLGALLASYSLIYPFYSQLLFVLLALGCMCCLQEPPRRTKGREGMTAWQGIRSTVSLVLRRDAGLQSLTLFYGVSACGTLLLVWLAQGYMEAIALQTVYFGIVWAVLHLIMGLCSLQAHRLDELLGPRRMLLFLLVFSVFSFFALACVQSVAGLLFIVLLYAVRGIRTPLFRFYINRVVSSDVRATVLSVQGVAVRVCYLLAGPLFALTLEQSSLSVAFALAGALTFILLLFAFRRVCQTGILERAGVD